MSKTRTFTELSRLQSFEERFEYLKLEGAVGNTTFGFDRWMNQEFYNSAQWRQARREVIVRDNGCDLAVEGYDIHIGLLVHHMNPMSARDIESGERWIIDPEYLITTTQRTHNAIHFGDARLLPRQTVERRSGDTSLWTPVRKG